MPRHEYQISVEGGELCVTSFGATTDLPLLCVHGWTLNSSMWRYQKDLTQKDIRLISYDRRGYGDSNAPVNMTAEIADIVAIQQALGLDKINLMGMSQGGRICLRYAAQHPETINSLLLLSSSVDGFEGNPEPTEKIPLDGYREMMERGELDKLRKAWLAHPFMATQEANIQQHLYQMVQKYTGQDLTLPLDKTTDLTDLAAIQCPSLVMFGSQEPAYIQQIANYVSDQIKAQKISFEGQGHLANMTAATEFNQAVHHFLKNLNL